MTATTVTVNILVVRLLADWPSLTVTLMVMAPKALAAGVKVKVAVLLGLL